MNIVKKTGILAGTVVGGAVGGTMQVIGKMSGVKLIDNIGESIVNSTIYTGTIAGEIVSGGVELTRGHIENAVSRKKGEPLTEPNPHIAQGTSDLKSGGKKVVGNFVNNAKLVIENGGDVVDGLAHRDMDRVKDGAKRLVKIAAVGMMTVGAIKLAEDDDDKNKSDKKDAEEA